jgi:hypothetical protein
MIVAVEGETWLIYQLIGEQNAIDYGQALSHTESILSGGRPKVSGGAEI